MATIDLKYTRVPADKKYGESFTINSLPPKDFELFDKKMLGLGDLSMDGRYRNSLAVFLDLQGFTQFCNQVESSLVIPEFISRYNEWVFETIKNLFTESKTDKLVTIWGSLPFYAKFLGDGLLFLWDTDVSGGFSGICNIAINLHKLIDMYKKEFYPMIKKHVSNPPSILRCGIARGQVISIGNGKDYVGSCINIAVRLQKISQLTFAISRRGFDLSKLPQHIINNHLILKNISIRGIGDDELVYIRKDEYRKLSKEEKTFFKKT